MRGIFAGNVFDLGSAQVSLFLYNAGFSQEECPNLGALVFSHPESLRRSSQGMVYLSWLAVKTWFHDHGSLMTWTTSKPNGSTSVGRRSLLCFALNLMLCSDFRGRPLDKMNCLFSPVS